MPSISPIIAHIFDEPRGGRRRVRRDGNPERERFESKGRVPRRRSK